MPPTPELVDERLLVILRQDEVERPVKLGLQGLADARCRIQDMDPVDEDGTVGLGEVEEALADVLRRVRRRLARGSFE